MQNLDVCMPLPLQIVFDDVGWWSGADDSRQNGPYRTGISRRHVPADYLAVAELGRRLDMRPQAAMILCEWDRQNILKNVPSATWMGKNWDNSVNIGLQLDEAAEIIRSNSKHFEITLHGLGHEFWHKDGTFSRAEWADDTGLRPEEEIKLHLDYFYLKLISGLKVGYSIFIYLAGINQPFKVFFHFNKYAKIRKAYYLCL